MAVRPFSFDEEPALYCIFDVPGLHMDACFDRERFQGGVIEIKEKIAVWGQMDLHSAAADIARVYSAHDYNPRANSWPQSSLAFFSPLLSRLCVCSLLTTSALYALALLQFFIMRSLFAVLQIVTLGTVAGQDAVPVKSCGLCCSAAFKASIRP